MLRSQMQFVLVIGIVTLYVTINSHAIPSPAHVKRPLTNEEKEQGLQQVMELSRNFAFSIYERVTSYTDVVVSPLSFFVPMAMVCYTSRGDAKKSLLRALGIGESRVRMAKFGYEKLLDELANHDVRVESKIFISSNGTTVKPSFADMIEKVFNSEIETVDVTNGFMDSGKVNEWLSAQTKNNFTEIFESQHIGPDPNIVFSNRIYFKGIWNTAFDSSSTKLRPFHPLGDGTLNVSTMYTIGDFRHGRLDDCEARFIEIPYKSNRSSENDALSMFVIIPNEYSNLVWMNMMFKLAKINLLERLLNSTEEKMEVYLPKFKIESEVTAGQIRVREFFEPGFPDDPFLSFSKLFEPSGIANFGNSSSKVVIEVGEEGHEAAGSSGTFYNTMGRATLDRKTRSISQKVKQFKVDRPFVAIIASKGKILTEIFLAWVTGSQFIPKNIDPTEWRYVITPRYRWAAARNQIRRKNQANNSTKV